MCYISRPGCVARIVQAKGFLYIEKDVGKQRKVVQIANILIALLNKVLNLLAEWWMGELRAVKTCRFCSYCTAPRRFSEVLQIPSATMWTWHSYSSPLHWVDVIPRASWLLNAVSSSKRVDCSTKGLAHQALVLAGFNLDKVQRRLEYHALRLQTESLGYRETQCFIANNLDLWGSRYYAINLSTPDVNACVLAYPLQAKTSPLWLGKAIALRPVTCAK